MGKNFSNDNNNKFEKEIEVLVEFHEKWKKHKNSYIPLTIRQISTVIYCLCNNKENYTLRDLIYLIYGFSFSTNERNEMNKFMSKIAMEEKFNYKNELPNFKNQIIYNEDFLKAFNIINFLLEKKKNVIITGKENTGKKQLAILIAKEYDKKYNNINNNEDPIICIVSNELNIQYLIGNYQINSNEKTLPKLEWKNGFLIDAIIKGRCVVLVGIDRAPSTVIERINCLFDIPYSTIERKFFIPEKGLNEFVVISPNFRIIATTNKIEDLSPAFLNRFKLIELENQFKIENINERILWNLYEIYLKKKIKILKKFLN